MSRAASGISAAAVFIAIFLSVEPAAAAAPRVLASIKPIHSLAAAVMEGLGKPELLITGAASEHGYMLRPSDAKKIASAQVVFWVGPDLETYLIAPLASLSARACRSP